MTDIAIPTLKDDERIPLGYCAAPDADLSGEGMRFVCAFPGRFSVWLRDRFPGSAEAPR